MSVPGPKGSRLHLATAPLGQSVRRIVSRESSLSLALKLSLSLERFKRVVDDGAIARAVHKLPHAAGDRSIPAHDVREALADVGPIFIDQAGIPVKESAARSSTQQNRSFFRGFRGVMLQKLGAFQSHGAGKTFDITL